MLTLAARRAAYRALCWRCALKKWRVHWRARFDHYRRELLVCHPLKGSEEVWLDSEKWQQVSAAGKSLFTGLYIGWPFFRSYMGDAGWPMLRTLSQFGGPFYWGILLTTCAVLLFAGLRCGNCALQRLAAHLNLTVWGALVGLLAGTFTPGVAVPIGLWMLLDEFRRLRRMGHERRAVC